jgi:NAD(P)-dependent dehydrogenase (short-subunit alcohol dehydrogenase family)
MQVKPNLKEQVAIVAGATRGAGRGIAIELGAAGATVYCTGRSVRDKTSGRPETIDETAELVSQAGGVGIAVQVDHTQPGQVKALFQRIAKEQKRRLDIVVNDIWGGDELTQWVPFWKHSLSDGLTMLERAIDTHIITSHYAAPLLVKRGRGVIFEITDGKTYDYRGSFFYDLVKTTVMRMARTMAEDLKPHNVAAVAVTPGFLRSEAMLDHFGVTEANWRDGTKRDKFFAFSETPHYIGRAIAALAADPHLMAKTGQAVATWDLAEEYGFTDLDGSQPHWQRNYEAEMKRRGSDPRP